MLIEMPVLSFLIEETDEYRKWSIRPRQKNPFAENEPNPRYQVVVKFGKHELAVIPVFEWSNDFRNKDEEESVIAETIEPYMKKIFAGSPGWT